MFTEHTTARTAAAANRVGDRFLARSLPHPAVCKKRIFGKRLRHVACKWQKVLFATASSGRIRAMLTIHILSFSFLEGLPVDATGHAGGYTEGHEHQLVNDGAEPLVFLAVMPGPKA